jgi:hypothetical protein
MKIAAVVVIAGGVALATFPWGALAVAVLLVALWRLS